MAAKLCKLASAPCTVPCSVGLTVFVMIACADGMAMPPSEPATMKAQSSHPFDALPYRMKAMAPRVALQVPNTLTGEGNLNVELTFERMEDFSPAAVAERVDALKKLLDARKQLANLITYMDGKAGAEALVQKLLQDPALLQSLASTKKAETPES